MFGRPRKDMGATRMALRFIIGNSVKNNRQALLRDMLDRSSREDREVFFFVPEQANLEAEQELTSMQKYGCVLKIDIVSFRRLLHRLTDELGDRLPTVLDDIGKSLLLRRVLSEHAQELPRFGSKAAMPGFVTEVKSLLSEFVRYEVSAEALDEASGRTEDTLLADKLSELSKVYRWFRERCGNTHITEDDIYNAMCPLVRESKRLRGSILYFDGYTGFTPTQYNLVGELMKTCRDVVITVTIDPEESEHEGVKTECFRMSRETMRTMERLAQESGHEVAWQVVPGVEDGGTPELGYLAASLFRRGRNAYAGRETGALQLVSAADREAEVRFAATEIARLVRDAADGSDVRYRDIGIVCGDVKAYSEVYRRTFSEAGIPFFIDRTSEVMDNCLVDYIRSLLQMFRTDMRTDACMRWLKNPINRYDYDRDMLCHLENFLIARGVRGFSMWKRGLKGDYGGRRVTKAGACIALAESITTRIVPLADVMMSSATTVREKTEALYLFLRDNAAENVRKLEGEIEREPVPWNRRRSEELAAAYRGIVELLERLHEILPEEKMPLREYMDLLDAGFAEMRLGVIPPDPDCVMIGDCKRSRISRVRFLFVTGVNEGLIPGSGHGSELLNVKERELLKQQYDISLADTEKESVDSEEFNVLLALQKPSERLVLTWSRTDGEGKSLSESYVIRRIQRLFPELRVRDTAQERRTFFERIAVDGGMEELLSRYAEAVRGTQTESADRAALRTLYDWYCAEGSERSDGRLQTMLQEAEQGMFRQPELSAEVAEQLYPEDTEYSVTRLESFAECPFRHFAEYGLAAKERCTYEPTQLETGSLCHAILEYAGTKASEVGAKGRTPTPDEMEAFVREGAEHVSSLPEFECFFEDNRSRYLFDSLTEELAALAPSLSAQLLQGRYRIDRTEMTFSEKLGDVRYRGKIDRIDRCDAKGATLLKLVDYKSGGKPFKEELALDGIDIQLPLYLRVTEKMLREEGVSAVPAAALYMPLTVDYRDGEPDGTEQTVSVKSYAPNGVMRVDSSDTVSVSDSFLSQLDVNFASLQPGEAYSSDVVSVSVQKNGTFGKGCVYTGQKLEQFLDRVEAVASDEVARIRGGEIAIHPYRYGSGAYAENSCRYCVYKGLCRRESGTSLVYREPGEAAKRYGDAADPGDAAARTCDPVGSGEAVKRFDGTANPDDTADAGKEAADI